MVQIAKACPNKVMKIHAQDYRFSVVSNRAEILALEDPPADYHDVHLGRWRSLSETMKNCTSLVKLLVFFNNKRSVSLSEFTKALLHMRMDSLQKLVLEGLTSEDCSSDPIEYIATVASNLKELSNAVQYCLLQFKLYFLRIEIFIRYMLNQVHLMAMHD